MGFWDEFKARYNRGNPRPQPEDWQAVDAMIKDHPALQPKGSHIPAGRHLLLLLFLMISTGTGPHWEILAPPPPGFLPHTEMRNMEKKPLAPGSTCVSAKRIIRGLPREASPKLSAGSSPPKIKSKKPKASSPAKVKNIASGQGKRLSQFPPKSPLNAPSPNHEPGKAPLVTRQIAPSLSGLRPRPYGILPPPKGGMPRLQIDSLGPGESPTKKHKSRRAHLSVGWEGQFEISGQHASRSAQGLILRYRKGRWSWQSGWLKGHAAVRLSHTHTREHFRVDSTRQLEIRPHLVEHVYRYWVIDSFFQGGYQYDTIYQLRQDSLVTWRQDTTRVKTTISQDERGQLQYQSLPLLIGYHWDWGRWELLIQAGTRLEHWRYKGLEGRENDFWQLSTQLRPQLLYHLSPHWQVGLGAGWSQPLRMLSDQSLSCTAAGQLNFHLVYQW